MNMKKIFILVLMMTAFCGVVCSQPSGNNGGGEKMQSNRVYHVFANSETDSSLVAARNESLVRSGAPQRSLLVGLGSAILSSYCNKFIQETVNLSSNAIGFAVKTLSALIYKNKNDRESWLKTAEQQNHFTKLLQTSIYIDDFYYGSSTNGALDPMNMKFNGFGCMCYMRPDHNVKGKDLPKAHYHKLKDSSKSEAGDLQDGDQETPEIWEFFLTCKLREDSLGREHIVKHSKFYVEVDQLVFDTRHSSLPNDSLSGKAQKKFDFKKRKDLTFTVNVKVFSSWVNEAIMLTDNQQIGEFNITAKIDSNDLNPDGVFVYDPALHSNKVKVVGESFIVPRSYTGTINAPSWGSGQYRLVMTVSEDCNMNLSYYQKPPRKNHKQSEELADGTPMHGKSKAKPRWDNKKWQAEWKEMQAGRKRQTVFDDAWRSVTTAYVNKDWVQELVSPLTTAVNNQEKLALSKLLNVSSQNGTGNSGPSTGSENGPNGSSNSGYTAPPGSVPNGGK